MSTQDFDKSLRIVRVRLAYRRAVRNGDTLEALRLRGVLRQIGG